MNKEIEAAYAKAIKCQAEADTEPKAKAEAAWAAVAAAQWRETSAAIITDDIMRKEEICTGDTFLGHCVGLIIFIICITIFILMCVFT